MANLSVILGIFMIIFVKFNCGFVISNNYSKRPIQALTTMPSRMGVLDTVLSTIGITSEIVGVKSASTMPSRRSALDTVLSKVSSTSELVGVKSVSTMPTRRSALDTVLSKGSSTSELVGVKSVSTMPTRRSALDTVLSKGSSTSELVGVKSVSTMPTRRSALDTVLSKGSSTSELVGVMSVSTMPTRRSALDTVLSKISRASKRIGVKSASSHTNGINEVNDEISSLAYISDVITESLKIIKGRNIVPTSKDQGLHYPSFDSTRKEEDVLVYIQYLTSIQLRDLDSTDLFENYTEWIKNLLADSLCYEFKIWCQGNRQRPTRTPHISFKTKSASEFQAIVLQTLTKLETYVIDWRKQISN